MNNLMTKSFLSYADLKKAALQDDLEAADGAAAISDVELSAAAASDERLRAFFAEAAVVKDEMDTIRAALARLQADIDQARSLHQSDALRALRARSSCDVVAVLKTARTIRSRLEKMDAVADPAELRRSASGRTRAAVTGALRTKLKELMVDFQALRQRMMSEYKETVERRFFTLTGKIPDDALIEQLVTDDRGEELLTAAVAEHGRGAVLAVVTEMQDRHDAAKELERALLELHQVFLDMAVVVETQGEKMDDIEHHVVSAGHYVMDGNKELAGAKGYQKSSRRCACVAAIVLLILVMLAIVIPVASGIHKS